MPSLNEAVVAAAGSGKTQYLIEQAVADPGSRILILTYTNENLRQLNARLWSQRGGFPPNVETMTLVAFLLRECVKPYQSVKTDEPNLIRSVQFQDRPASAQNAGIRRFKQFFLNSSGDVYSDHLAQAAFVINEASGGAVIRRLERLWAQIFVDEAQDLAGYDLMLLEVFLRSQIRILLVGDPRQGVYATNNNPRYKQYRGSKIVSWVDGQVATGILSKKERTECRRSVASICSFADQLYPDLPTTVSTKPVSEGRHAGVFFVLEKNLEEYRAAVRPQELRWDRRNKKAGPTARNMGEVKGSDFPDVLIFLTQPMIDYLDGVESTLKPMALAKFYVAITRAEYSVGLLVPKAPGNSSIDVWGQ